MAPEAASQAARKTVTVVFADLTGSTGLAERLDPEALRRIMHRYYEEMRTAVERHGGTVEKFIGDAVMAVFGIPLVHEDDALRAVRAATEMQERLAALNVDLGQEWDLRLDVRIGVNTGEVVAGDPAAAQAFVVGDAVNVAARLEQAAEPGQVLIGEATYRLVRDAVEVDDAEELHLKGRSDPSGARRLLAVRAGAPGHVRRLDLPLVGRRRELEQLTEAFERTAREDGCRLVTVVGPAGIGKSRLVGELVAHVREGARVAQGRCLPYGDGITYWPVAEAVRQLAVIGEGDSVEDANARLVGLLADETDGGLVAQKLAAAVGLGAGAAATEEVAWAVRRLFEASARERPLVVVFDDIQWGEATFLDLLENLVEAAGAPILVVAVARPELADVRPGWGERRANATSVRLEPLPDEECRLLVERRLGDGELDERAKAQLVQRAQGNPFFVEELLAMLLDTGLLERENGRWALAADVETVPIPDTIHALLAARLDRLPADERRVIECAAVEGEAFEREAVAGLLGELDPELPLRSLVRKELVAVQGAGSYRFRHLLIRDAAYAAIPKEVRAELHRRFADWLERASYRVAEHEEILGYHLEEAVRYHAELGRRRSDDVVETAARAAGWLGSAGLRAAGRGDLSAAAKLLERAVRLLPEDDGRRSELELDLGWVLIQSGEFAAADAVLAVVVESAAARGERRLELRGLVERMEIVNIVEPEGAAAETFRLADEVVPELEALGDDLGLAHAWRMVAYAHNTICRYGDAAAALERGLAYAERAGDAALRSDILSWLPTRLVRGPMHTSRALERCRELLAGAAGDRTAEAGGLAAIALIEAIRGRFDEARAAERASRAIKQELDLRFMLAVGDIWRGELELIAGDVAAAEAAFRAAAEFLDERGDRHFYPTAAVGLARACFLQERYDEAWEALRAAEATTASDDYITVVWALGTRARLLAREQRLEEAREAAERGVRLSFETDDLNLQADALVELAAVADEERARAALEEAVEIAERKGNVVVAGLAREALGR